VQFYALPLRRLPRCLPKDDEFFVIGDVHGQAELLRAALETIRTTPETVSIRHLIFLGDLIDRGPVEKGLD